ncbi:MAG: exo-alpha-sialidase [Bacteroidaceae bacterium]|nr:exo-alpha-sialidase [Bacteroidaceae bacterium]
MKKFYVMMVGMLLTAFSGFAQDYKTNYTASDKSSNGSRYPSSLMVTSPEYGQQTIDWATGTGHALFTDATASEITVASGEEIQLTVNYSGTWMSAYVYIDLDNDKQFSFDVDAVNHKALEGSDLVSWSFYSFDSEKSEDPGWNSVGTQITGSARSTVNCPKFNAPTNPGTYRARVKIDWNDIDPAGSVAGHLGGSMQANGGAILDFTLIVEKAFVPVQLYFNQASGVWTASNPAGTWAASYKTNATDPFMTVSCPQNNMAWDANGDPKLYMGTVTPRENQWTVAVEEGYMISDLTFNTSIIDGQWSSVTIDGGTEIETPGTIEAHNINKPSISFTIKTKADNKGVLLTNFVATVVKSKTPETKQVIFVYDKTEEHNVTYRIPSILSIPAGAHKGRVVALTDYRPGGVDVGGGEVSIHSRISDDFGQTWGDEKTVVKGEWGSSKGTRWYSFGDPVSIADRETGKILAVSCSGNVMYTGATRSNHQGVETYFSEDGETWTEPVDVSEQLYSQLDAIGIQSLFVGSGGFTQSKFVKKGDYYRVYGGILCRTSSGSGINFTIYTDDFGATWNILGGSSSPAITSGGDEAKVEELPDGSVLHSSRCNGGRIFNIWRWTDNTYTEGAWDGQANSNGSNKGIVAGNNSCNGEILIVPAKRKADDKCVYLAMQSIPFGSGRANVGIYWKELAGIADMTSATDFAANWTKGYQASYLGSAYSAMVLQEDGNIGFLVEEETFGFGYSQVYHNLSYEMITDSLYTFKSDADADFDKSAFFAQKGRITLNLQWDGVTKNTVEAAGYYGSPVTTTDLPDFVDADLPVLTADNDGTIVDVPCTWSASAPVQLSTDAQKNYYYIWIKDNAYIVGAAPSISVTAQTTQPVKNTAAMWSFVGNPFDGMQLVNFDGAVLATEDPRNDGNTGGLTYPHIVEGETTLSTTWMLVSSSYYAGGFFIFNKDYAVAMNHRSPNLAYWTGGYDAGSTFRAVAVPEEEIIEVGVNNVRQTIAPAAFYNIAGQRVAAPKQGLYIISGKKCVVK